MIFIYVDLTGSSGCGFDLFGIATGWGPFPHLKLLKKYPDKPSCISIKV